MGPGHAGGHLPRQRGQHRVALATISFYNRADPAGQMTGGTELRRNGLRQRRTAQVHALLGGDKPPDELHRRRDPRDAQPRTQGLAEGGQVDDAALPVQRRQRGRWCALERQLAIRIVLDHQRPVLPGQLEQPQAAVIRHRHARRVLEVRHHIDQFGAASVAGQARQRLFQHVGPHPGVVLGDTAHLRPVTAEDLQRSHVRGKLDDDQISRIEEHAPDQVQALLGSQRDQHLVPRDVDPILSHPFHQLIAQARIALRGTVLQDQVGLALQQPCRDGFDLFDGKRGGIGQAAGKRDDVPPPGELEQLPDEGAGHHPRAGRIEILPVLFQRRPPPLR